MEDFFQDLLKKMTKKKVNAIGTAIVRLLWATILWLSVFMIYAIYVDATDDNVSSIQLMPPKIER